MLRISGGQFRGRRLKSPPKSWPARPTTERVREALFSMITDELHGASVLDLFAGCGCLGLEALSRGAARACFIEQDGRMAAVIRQNLELCDISKEQSRVIRGSAIDPRALRGVIAQGGTGIDLVMMDPPYAQDWPKQTLKALLNAQLLSPGALVVCEHEREASIDPPETSPLEKLTVRAYGKTALTLLRNPLDGS
ncbi:MAG: 16S rRNA (guanine(966)-N(2))-methyltransferase RsmD [Magnetococcales bacterium]|nr:16S rRNA (guanine(966)-N(2))-methyltransferase RsmD [Magnetococcales bacterium]